MKKKGFILYFLLVACLFIPKCVFAREVDGFNFKDGTFIHYGDVFNFGQSIAYNCGGGKKCPFYDSGFLRLFVEKIIYPDGSEKGYYNGYLWSPSAALTRMDVYDGGEYKMDFPDYQEMANLLTSSSYYNFDDSYVDMLKWAKITGKYVLDFDYVDQLDGLAITIDLRKEEYKINYNNIYDVQNPNPIMYTNDDGSINLRDINHQNLKFAGWYLDADYKTKVDTISKELFSDIANNGTLQLYAKWEEEIKLPDIVNPKTSSGKIFLPTILVIICIAISYFVFRKHEKC